ncbi:hypothetical protein BDV96DRAFT_123796 [Lophiotrema nucula]|uniref:Uncharacterized protein n=1 Tax=Lophiotrema nucula TaxID=690887 RepID=A0A6A5Z1R1_9PLEO|nr:hypothetical protein BDV96DRAFT_123796 [Lophiotrema nucula]
MRNVAQMTEQLLSGQASHNDRIEIRSYTEASTPSSHSQHESKLLGHPCETGLVLYNALLTPSLDSLVFWLGEDIPEFSLHMSSSSKRPPCRCIIIHRLDRGIQGVRMLFEKWITGGVTAYELGPTNLNYLALLVRVTSNRVISRWWVGRKCFQQVSITT